MVTKLRGGCINMVVVFGERIKHVKKIVCPYMIKVFIRPTGFLWFLKLHKA